MSKLLTFHENFKCWNCFFTLFANTRAVPNPGLNFSTHRSATGLKWGRACAEERPGTAGPRRQDQHAVLSVLFVLDLPLAKLAAVRFTIEEMTDYQIITTDSFLAKLTYAVPSSPKRS